MKFVTILMKKCLDSTYFKSRLFFPHFPTVHIFVMLDCYQTFKMSVVSSFINTFLPGKTIVLIYHIDIDILLINGY